MADETHAEPGVPEQEPTATPHEMVDSGFLLDEQAHSASTRPTGAPRRKVITTNQVSAYETERDAAGRITHVRVPIEDLQFQEELPLTEDPQVVAALKLVALAETGRHLDTASLSAAYTLLVEKLGPQATMDDVYALLDQLQVPHTLDSQGIPLMPEMFDRYDLAPPSSPSEASGPWSPTEEDAALPNYLWRVGGKAARRAWPWVLLGAGWLWGRAQGPLAQAQDWTETVLDEHGLRLPGPTTRRRWVTRIGHPVGMALTVLVLLGLLGSFVWVVMLPLLQPHPGTPPLARATLATTADGTPIANLLATPVPTTAAQGTPKPGQPTPVPTWTPAPAGQPTPNPFGTSATVSLTRRTQTVSAPATLGTCDGCANSASAGTVAGQKVSATANGVAGPFGNVWTQTQSATASALYMSYYCNGGTNGCYTPAGVRVADQSGNGYDCITQSAGAQSVGQVDWSVVCVLIATGPITSSQVNYDHVTAPCSACSAWWGGTSQKSTGQNAAYSWFSPSSCTSQGASTAGSAAESAAAGQLGSGLGTNAIAVQMSLLGGAWCSYPSTCSSVVNSQQSMSTSQYQVCQTGSAWKLTYDASQVQTLQVQRLVAPSGYTLGGATTCASPDVSSADVGTVRATISCPTSASATASVDANALKAAIAGHTVSEAQAIVNGWSGVVSGSVAVSVPGGAPRLPQDANAITISFA